MSALPLRPRTGFTLVELLVVIGIIALLISILLPSLTRARDQARLVACMSNMRQLGQANVFFTNEHDNYVVKPWFNNEPNNFGGGNTWGFQFPAWGWDYVLNTYISSKEVFRCPSDVTPDITSPNDAGDVNWSIRNEWSVNLPGGLPDDADDFPSSYRYNASNTARGPFFAVKLNQIENPGDAFLIVEGENSNFHHIATWEPARYGNGRFQGLASPNWEGSIALDRHRERYNAYMFFDGHANVENYDGTWRPVGGTREFTGYDVVAGGVTTKTVTPSPWRTTYLNSVSPNQSEANTYTGWQDVDPYVEGND